MVIVNKNSQIDFMLWKKTNKISSTVRSNFHFPSSLRQFAGAIKKKLQPTMCWCNKKKAPNLGLFTGEFTDEAELTRTALDHTLASYIQDYRHS